jgi:hypothetical protein
MSSPSRKIARSAHKKRKRKAEEWKRYVEAFVDLHGVDGAMRRVWAEGSPSAGYRHHHTLWVQWAARRRDRREKGKLHWPVMPHMVEVWESRFPKSHEDRQEAA